MKVAGSLDFKDISSFSKAIGLLKLKGWVLVEENGVVSNFQPHSSITLIASNEEGLFQINFLHSRLNEDLDFLKFLCEFCSNGGLRVAIEDRDELELIEIHKEGSLRFSLENFSRQVGVPASRENLPILIDEFLG